MLLLFIFCYLLVTIFIGYLASRRVKNAQDFVIAGRNLPLPLAATALFATWFGSETIMGASAEFTSHGLLGVIEDPFGAALCLILVGAFFTRPLYRLNILTFNDFFRLRFSRKAEVISAIFMVPSYFGWIAAQLVALAIILQTLAGIPLVYGILLCAGVVLFYTYIGGMWAVSVTDFVQTIMIVAGLLILAWQLVGLAGGLEVVLDSQPDEFYRFLPDAGWQPGLEYLAAWITIGLGSIPQQDVFQRVMAAKSADTAVRSAYLGGFLYLFIGLLPLLIAIAGTVLYPSLAAAEDQQMFLPSLVLQHASLPLQILFFGALLSAILSTTSGAMLAPATVIGENLVRPLLTVGQLSREEQDRRLLRIMRYSLVGVALASAAMAASTQNIYELVGQSSALSLVALFVPLTAGLYWKRASRAGTYGAIVMGTLVWLYFECWPVETPSLLLGGAASLVAMIAGSILRPDNSHQEFIQETSTA
ncbi:sodium:solute symporter family protein [Lewinella sp. W8]|uniref:sodium:solute symporter family protein n=1 Tax=Lewinella sp. W8 TaxID=2528208 RepID=UPI001067A651|nr:sodium:solute symporter family protein [Lewinella sp. W8]MTB52118.1 sodium:solute symporter [Lewinella sp. W8]